MKGVMYLLVTLPLLVGIVSAQQMSLKIGLLLPDGSSVDNDVGYKTSIGAITVALNLAIKNQIYNPSLYNITFIWAHQCSEALAVGYASNMIKKEKIAALFAAEIIAALTHFKKIPVFFWSSAINSKVIYRQKYATITSAGGTITGLIAASGNLLRRFNWTQVGLIYTKSNTSAVEHIPFCDHYLELYQRSYDTYLVNVSTYTRYVSDEDSTSGFQSVLNSMNTRTRIIVACLDSRKDRQNLMLAAIANKMIGEEYVYLIIQNAAMGFDEPFWEGAGNMTSALKEAAIKSVIILDRYTEKTSLKPAIDKEIVENIKKWPFYCSKCQTTNVNASNLSFYLGDAFYVYLICLNLTYTRYGFSQFKNATAVLESLLTDYVSFPSILGNNFTLSPKGGRIGRFAIWSFDSDNNPTVWGIAFGSINDTGRNFTDFFTDEATSLWVNRNGKRPLAIPICGFNNVCPPSTLFYISVSAGSVFLFLSIVVGLGILICVYQRQHRRRLNALWQINFMLLKPLENKGQRTTSHSFMSEISQYSSDSKGMAKNNNTDHTEFFYYDNELVVARKHPYHGKWVLAEEEEFRKMRKVDNLKLNRFLGVAVSNNFYYVLWGYCDRGNIIEVIQAHSFRVDAYIMVEMMKEIAEGLHYIHNSSLVQHGCLDSYCCVVGDRFDVKIQLYGCSGMKSYSIRQRDNKHGLYVAPELLQGRQNEVGSQAGDIYAFAIIASVVLTMKPAYGIEDMNEKGIIEDTINAVSRGRYPPVRPSLETNHALDIHPDLIMLIRDCWSELPSERPSISHIRDTLFKRFGGSSSTNLMDHMFSLMENSAAELEQDVKMRTVELQNEQKKADILLYRIMPREAADSLKLGHAVAPEVFEEATVFFSDIVGFTILSSKSTPLQIINFLNSVYTLTDSVMEKYDVYKVETIGDGMHVVSGVPKRNGHAHVKAIADMAIDFQRSVKTLKMAHLPDQQIQMRVGVNSGSCVAGIVGVTNPRYVVFGDTTNIAAKMEASGKPGRIHITPDTKALIQSYYPGFYKIFDRGETLIKGIGPMNTFWIALPEEAENFQP